MHMCQNPVLHERCLDQRLLVRLVVLNTKRLKHRQKSTKASKACSTLRLRSQNPRMKSWKEQDISPFWYLFQPLQLLYLPLQHIRYTPFRPVKTTSFPPDTPQLWHCRKSLSACLLGLWCASSCDFPLRLLLFVLHLLAIPQGPVSLWHWLFSFILRLKHCLLSFPGFPSSSL